MSRVAFDLRKRGPKSRQARTYAAAGPGHPPETLRESKEAVMSIEVRDVMGLVAIAVTEDASFAEIVRVMQRFAVGAVTVVDAERRPVGIVSEDDLLLKEIDTVRRAVSLYEGRREQEAHQKAAAVVAAELMTSPAITVTPATAVRDAARVMHHNRIKQLPVIDPVTRHMVGTLHQSDVLRVFTRPMVELESDVAAIVGAREGLAIDIDQGVVTLRGHVGRRSEALQLAERILLVEGVIDVRSELTHDADDLLIAPPLS